MNRTPRWYLVLMGALILALTGCRQSTPESPQEVVEDRVSQLSLAGTAWEVESFGGPEDMLSVLPDTRLTVNYLVERYAGSGGCNWYLGVYSTEGSSLRMQTPTTTMLICKSADIMQQEGTFLESLANVTEYRKEGDRLMAYTVEDQRLLTLAPAQPVSFEGTTWDLKFVYDDDEWLSLISGSTITAQFEDDQMSGSAGCNSYNATVSKEGETLTISNVASTRKACAEPEGIMEQESLYLSKLSSVKGLKTVGDALALLDADGQAILVLGAR